MTRGLYLWNGRRVAGLLALCLGLLAVGAPASAVDLRITPSSPVPACVTPERLMAFLATRNDNLDRRYRDIARLYKQHGDAWHVRWDYAFFQMAIETNFLTYLRADGRRGDVDPRQNNFAGIGTTGGGVPGDSFPDVSTGVLAQIQHLVVYSGERIAQPVAPRTQLKQDDILLASQRVLAQRPMSFQDLAGRWAADKGYGRTIEAIADRYRAQFCTGPPSRVEVASAPAPRARPDPAGVWGANTKTAIASVQPAPVPAAGVRATRCRVLAASYGGKKTLLIRAITGGEEQFTALQVLDGFERSMAENFIGSYAQGGASVGEFASREAALTRAYELCPTARPPAGAG